MGTSSSGLLSGMFYKNKTEVSGNNRDQQNDKNLYLSFSDRASFFKKI